MPGRAKTILVVDDDEPILKLVDRILSPPHTVLRAASGAEALELFKAQGESIDLVLLDLGLPGMSGYEILAEMQITDPDIDVVVITGLTPDDERLPGVRAVLDKPFSAADLHAIVGSARE